MCCVFTCCGWMIDLFQRIWTFAMSCCISSAICCVMMTSSLSGIALGYNYSLAEYIDLKETNVSVYLKRGVFDDEIADDMEWRRAGHMPVGNNQFPDDTVVTGGPDVEPPLRSGRRLDDSVFDSNDHNKFEGSLMKLTAKPIDAPITLVTYTPDHKMGEIQEKYQHNTLDKMKAIQEVLNMRRHNLGTTCTMDSRRQMTAVMRLEEPQRPEYGMYPPKRKNDISADIISGRKFDPHDPSLYKFLNPARTAVPPQNIGNPEFWRIPKEFPSTKLTYGLYNEILPIEVPTIPGPVPLNLGPIRPTSKKGSAYQTYEPQSVKVFADDNPGPEEMKSVEEFDQKRNREQMDLARARLKEFPQRRQGGGAGEEDYDVDAKGLPVRKRREIVSSSTTYLPTTLDVRRSARNRRDIYSSKYLPTTLNENRHSAKKRTENSSSKSLPTTLNDVRRSARQRSEISSFKSLATIFNEAHRLARQRTELPTTLNDISRSAGKEREIFSSKSPPTTLNGVRRSAKQRSEISSFKSLATIFNELHRFARQKTEIPSSKYFPTTLNDITRSAGKEREISSPKSFTTTVNDVRRFSRQISEISSFKTPAANFNDIRSSAEKKREISSSRSLPTTLNDVRRSASQRSEISSFKSLATIFQEVHRFANQKTEIPSSKYVLKILNDMSRSAGIEREISSSKSPPTTPDVRRSARQRREISKSLPITLDDVGRSARKGREISNSKSFSTTFNSKRISTRRRRDFTMFNSFPTILDKTESLDVLRTDTEILSEIRRTLLLDKLTTLV